MDQQRSGVGMWVKIHLERQSETSTMPEHIIGYLAHMTPTHYVLSKVLTVKQDEETDFDIHYIEEERIFNISATYVWGFEVLKEIPTGDEEFSMGGIGGLG